ncbi:MAG: hypothetical protein A6F72_04670 [Cycloclasticus sp. symbiont of Poecilosclerida sp. N]|nr:MAG: hypothetical protein A6F72_04670 [Cycloclasticus sp. symbiont of Poecilosclerida sp. N]
MSKQATKEVSLKLLNNKRLASLCGQFNEHLTQLEGRLNVEIKNRVNPMVKKSYQRMKSIVRHDG